MPSILHFLHQIILTTLKTYFNIGRWTTVKCDTDSLGEVDTKKTAYCQTDTWFWDSPADCPLGNIGTLKARRIFSGKNILFLGDSIVRNVFFQFHNLIDPEMQYNITSGAKHSDIKYSPIFLKNTTINFYWAPLLTNVSTVLRDDNIMRNADIIVIGSAAWHALNVRDINSYSQQLQEVGGLITKTINDKNNLNSKNNNNIGSNNVGNIIGSNSSDNNNKLSYIWLQPTTIIDSQLNSPDKVQYMKESTMQIYRQEFLNSTLSKIVKSVIDPSSACKGRETVDGVHYNRDVYQVIAQMIANAYVLHVPTLYNNSTPKKKPTYGPKKTGSMSFPKYGAIVLALAAIMLFSMDSFLGKGFMYFYSYLFTYFYLFIMYLFKFFFLCLLMYSFIYLYIYKLNSLSTYL